MIGARRFYRLSYFMMPFGFWPGRHHFLAPFAHYLAGYAHIQHISPGLFNVARAAATATPFI